MFKIRSFSYAKKMIKDLKRHGPASIIHLVILSTTIERPIYVWNNDGTLNTIVGKNKTGNPIDVEYHSTDPGQIGHWTLKCGKDPTNISLNLNSCLFSVIGSQIEQDPSTLRRWILIKLISNFQHLDRKIKKILQLKKNSRMSLFIGGARYVGTSMEDARRLLDYAETNYPHPLFKCSSVTVTGHPRGHADVSEEERTQIPPNARTFQTYATEMFTKKPLQLTPQTAFLSREDQDYFAHYALSSLRARTAMCDLNTYCQESTPPTTRRKPCNGKTPCNQEFNVSAIELQTPLSEQERDNRFVCNKWQRGQEIQRRRFVGVRLVLRHQYNKADDPDADVFVHTFYPIPES